VSARKAVVTGGSGNLGRWTVKALIEAGYEVLSLDSVRAPERLCECWTADLTQSGPVYEALQSADCVVHLAAHQAPFMAADTDVFRNNIAITYNVMKAAADIGVPRVVHASSIAAFGFAYATKTMVPDYLPLDEEYLCKPQDPYALSKVFGEQLADSFVGISEMTVASLRIAGVNFDLAYETLPERWADPAKGARTFWSYIDVRDAAAACRLAADAQIDGHEIFNIAAATSRYLEPTADLVVRYFPGTTIRDGFVGNWGGLDTSRAHTRLGFAARHVWEDYIRPDGTPVSGG
jgi:nucleoside-diphosphate-sugar epimerase